MIAVADNPRTEILKRLKDWNLEFAWLAERIGTSKQNVTNWLSVGREPHDDEAWDKMLEALPPERELSSAKIPVSYKLVKMPMAGEVPAGEWGDPLAAEEFEEVDAKFDHPRRFVCIVVGDSCYPHLQPGDKTIWHADSNAPYGVIVLAQKLEDHGCTVKELTYDSENYRPRLHPLNPTYGEPLDGTGWRVMARLVGVIRNVDGLEQTWFLQQGLRRRHLTVS